MKLSPIAKAPDGFTFALWCCGLFVIVAALADPSWPDWQAVAVALFLGFCIGADVEAARMRRSLSQQGGPEHGK